MKAAQVVALDIVLATDVRGPEQLIGARSRRSAIAVPMVTARVPAHMFVIAPPSSW